MPTDDSADRSDAEHDGRAPRVRVRDGPADVIVYTIAAFSYVVIGLAWKPLLNWVIGPLWIVAVVTMLSRVVPRRDAG